MMGTIRWGHNDGFGVPFVVAVATLAVLVVTLLVRRRTPRGRHGYKLPPGPRGWPILGSLPMLGPLPHRALFELSKKYGPLMLLHLGSVKALVVTSPQMSEQILKTHDSIMSSRRGKIVSRVFLYNGNDIVTSPYGQQWRHYRKVFTTELLSSARVNHFQGSREREVLATLQFIEEGSQLGKAVNLTECFGVLLTNNVTEMLMRRPFYGQRGKLSLSATDSTESATLPKMAGDVLQLCGAFNMADYFPVIKSLDLQGLNKRTRAVFLQYDKFLQEVIDEHRLKKTQGHSEKDFVDVLLEVGKTNELEEPLSMDAIKGLLSDVVTAGIDTSSAECTWAFAELLRHPHVMSKVQEELDSVVGPDRLVKEADIPALKYFGAVVKEVFRLHPPAPLLVPHLSTEDCTIGGYFIPAGTQIFVNAWGIQRDSTVWERASDFYPDRFLNSAIDLKGKDFELLPFGSGRRMCPGMTLGLITVQYVVAQLLHCFSWELADDQKPEDVDMSETFGVVCSKRVPLRAIAKARLPSHVVVPVK